MDEKLDLGSLFAIPPGATDAQARGEVFSGEDGTTYWVATQSPTTGSDRFGTAAVLEQRQYFRKTDESCM